MGRDRGRRDADPVSAPLEGAEQTREIVTHRWQWPLGIDPGRCHRFCVEGGGKLAGHGLSEDYESWVQDR